MRVAICFILTVGLSVLAISCGGDSDGDGAGGDGGGGGGGPESVARRYIQAQIEGDDSAFLDTLRPDQRGDQKSLNDLSGCSLGQAEVLAQETSPSEAEITVVFGEPCGTREAPFEGEPFETCTVRLEKLSGRWYVNDNTSRCPVI